MKIFLIKQIFRAGKYSVNGLFYALREERAFQQETFVLLVLFFLGIFFCSFGNSLILLASWLLVMMFELANSAIEKCLDLITQEINPMVKSAKDMASAAVFLSICFNVLIWLKILIA